MNREYLAMGKQLMYNATIVIDRFHVARYSALALKNIGKRVQKALLAEQRKYFRRSRKLLIKRRHEQRDDDKAAVELMLIYSRDRWEPYLLKEKFFQFMKSKNSREAEKQLKELQIFAAVADI